MSIILSAQGVEKSYATARGKLTILTGVDLELQAGVGIAKNTEAVKTNAEVLRDVCLVEE